MDLFLRVIAETAGSEDPRVRLTGLGFATLILLGMALRVYTLRKAAEDERRYNAALAAMPESDRQLLKKPKGVPPSLHVVGTVLLAGAAALAFGPGARTAIGEASYCPPRCPPGEECVETGRGRRVCGKQVRPAPPAPPRPKEGSDEPSEPESAAVLTTTPSLHRRDPFVRDGEE